MGHYASEMSSDWGKDTEHLEKILKHYSYVMGEELIKCKECFSVVLEEDWNKHLAYHALSRPTVPTSDAPRYDGSRKYPKRT